MKPLGRILAAVLAICVPILIGVRMHATSIEAGSAASQHIPDGRWLAELDGRSVELETDSQRFRIRFRSCGRDAGCPVVEDYTGTCTRRSDTLILKSTDPPWSRLVMVGGGNRVGTLFMKRIEPGREKEFITFEQAPDDAIDRPDVDGAAQ